ncbi:VOC family protein [Kineococcus sp. SYSU DK005]|uniref:VOC family protein n=1 Tax=Kineococcus sp. SYSU DK005 TaxID=3383126 RepID=UPI003D7C3BDD
MEQRISLITLGVRDLERARRFYEQLGWRGQQVQETVFFQAGGLGVVLWDRAKLAADCGLVDDQPDSQPGPQPDPVSGQPTDHDRPTTFSGIALAHNVHQRSEVDELLTTARSAGATITRPAAVTSYGGYAGVFTDPDGHAWEIAHNPGFPLADDGSLILPTFENG